MHIIDLNWSQFKTDIAAKDYPLNYKTLSVGYEVFAVDKDVILWRTEVLEAADITDFETNYKSNANKPFDSMAHPFAGVTTFTTGRVTGIAAAWTYIATFTVPAGKRAFIYMWWASPNVDGEGYLEINGVASDGGFVKSKEYLGDSLSVPAIAEAGQTIKIRFKPDSANAICYYTLGGILVKS